MPHLVTRELIHETHSSKINSGFYINEYHAGIINKSAAGDSSRTSVFLSHKHGDEDLVRDAVALFSSAGVNVYVDWLDPDMPPVTNPETARRLKEKIRSSHKFVLLATDAAVESKWCNWELGLGDAAKFHEHIAILPAGSRGKQWKGTEYLGLYPVITSEYEYTPGSFYVEHGQKRTPLANWLANRGSHG